MAMFSAAAWMATIVAAVAVAFMGLLEEAGACPHDPEACFFSADYYSARARFREAAVGANATLHRLHISAELDLTIDVAVLSSGVGEDAATLVHMSGAHGVEAYAGSAVQLALLRQWASQPPRGVRVVLVHVLNPYGFHCGRRFNEDNIDLCRNVLDDDEFAAIRDDERKTLYDEHEWLFNMRQGWTPVLDDFKFAIRMLYASSVVGTLTFRRSIAAGQYHAPEGLFYGGGPTMARSHALLLPLLRRIATPASAAIIIDVHTGLGPQGVDTIIPPFPPRDAASAAANARAIHAIFGGPQAAEVRACAPSSDGGSKADVLGIDFLIEAPTIDEAKHVSAGYELTRGSTESPDGYTARIGSAGWARTLAVCQEFGTWTAPLVLRAMIIEAAEWLHRRNDAESTAWAGCHGSAFGARAARDAFYVRRASWQRAVVRRGVRLAEAAVHALIDKPTLVPTV